MPMRTTGRDYAVVTASYWAFTLTDGALRTLVLFFLHRAGYSPFEVVSLFLFYELFGVVTTLLGGWLGARFGLKSTLSSGLLLQVGACVMLAWHSAALSVPIALLAQVMCGVAKDLVKTSAKSYVKLVVPTDDGRGLMRWVAVLTGSKNALKGVGFLLGGLLLETVGFRDANLLMALLLLVAVLGSGLLLPKAAGKSRSKVDLRHLLSPDPRVNWLAAARLFLFGARDVWFVFALPIFLAVDLGWSFTASSAFLACWTIGYGLVQAVAPRYAGGGRSQAPTAKHANRWTLALVLPLGALVWMLKADVSPTFALVTGLTTFGLVFASASAVHSFLIVHYAEGDKVSLRVGFYYMANAMGRLAGTVLSGLVFQARGQGIGGLEACLLASIAMVLLASLLGLPLRKAERASAGATGSG